MTVVRLLGIGVLAWALIQPAAAQNTPEIRDNLYAVSYADKQTGWVAGAFGTVFRTRDGGNTWTAQNAGTTESIYDVDFVDDRHGWAVGRSGLILQTGDGGETWSPQTSGTDKHLFGVDFVDAEVGSAVGDWGTILLTNDGGRTWQSRALPEDVILNDVVMVERTKGWIAGELGTILVTDDGGATWKPQQSGIEKTLFGIHFDGPLRGWAVGIDALVLHTEDGGTTWTVQNGVREVRELEQVGFSQAYENPSLYAIGMSGEIGVAVGEIGAVLLSRDGGHTWKRVAIKTSSKTEWFRDVSLNLGGMEGLIVGAGGKRVTISEGQLQVPDEVASAAEALH